MRKEDIRIDWQARLLLVILGVILFTPSAIIAWRNPTLLAIQHQRPVADRPMLEAVFSDPKPFFEDLDRWHKDYVGFGIRAGRLYRGAIFHFIGDSGAVNIERGPNDMIFLASHRADRSQSSIANSCPVRADWNDISAMIRKDWASILSVFREHGLEPVLLIYPSKKILYPEALPNTIAPVLRRRCQEMRDPGNPIVALASAFPQTVVDAYDDLSTHKNRPHFYPPENFHADGESAIRAAHAAMAIWDWPIEDIEDIAFRAHRTSSDLSYQLGFRLSAYTNEPIGETKPSIVPDQAALNDVRRELDAPVYAMNHVRPDAIINEDVLIIANSFGVRTAPYIARYASSVRIIQTNQLRRVEQLSRFFERAVFLDPPDRILFVLHDESVFEDRLAKYVAGLNAIERDSDIDDHPVDWE